MPKLPTLSGREIAAALGRLGFVEVSQRGSHLKLRRDGIICIVPLHREVKRGTLASVLRQADVSGEELMQVLSQ